MKIKPMSEEQIKKHQYRLSTSPEGHEFKPEDGTLVGGYRFVDVSSVARAAQADALRQVIEWIRKSKTRNIVGDLYHAQSEIEKETK